MSPIDVHAIRAVAELMRELELDEYASEHFSLKKSRHKPPRPEPTEAELLKQHLAPLPAEPWNDVPQSVADEWAQHADPGRSES